jgi:hypothetical protein
MSKPQYDSFLSYAIANFFDTFLVFWLSFLTIGLFNFIDKQTTTQDTPLPDLWMFVYEHIFSFSQWFVPILLGIFAVNAFFQTKLVARIVQKVIHAWILDSVAIIAGALLGSIYLDKGQLFFLEMSFDNAFSITAFSFAFYVVSILSVSIVTYTVQRYATPKSQPLAIMSDAQANTEQRPTLQDDRIHHV